MIKFVGKYISIGLLVGFGICTTEYIFWQFQKDEIKDSFELLKESIEDVRDMFYVDDLESIFSDPREYDPMVGLNFTLEGYKKLEGKIQVRGVVTNTGSKIWRGMAVEVEVFDGGGAIIAECNEFSEDLKPGHWEAMITECPIVDEFKDKEITEVTFKIKKAFYDKSIIKPYNK